MSRRLYAVEPLARIAAVRWREPDNSRGATDLARIAQALGIDRNIVRYWINRGGLTERAADHAAVALGMHPAEIWPEWWESVVSRRTVTWLCRRCERRTGRCCRCGTADLCV